MSEKLTALAFCVRIFWAHRRDVPSFSPADATLPQQPNRGTERQAFFCGSTVDSDNLIETVNVIFSTVMRFQFARVCSLAAPFLTSIRTTSMAIARRLPNLFPRSIPGLAVCALLWLCGCGDKPLPATLTLKMDGSEISGTVVRRDQNSITITVGEGDSRTYLYSEISNIKYGPSSGAAAPSGSATAVPASTTADQPAPVSAQSIPASGSFGLPAGTVLTVVNNGMIDSSLPAEIVTAGVIDSDVKAGDGKVLIPRGANVTIMVRDRKVVSGRLQMDFELGSADFYNRHYVISSARGWSEPGAVATLTGAQAGSQETKVRGENVHLIDQSLMEFKTQTPTVFKVSQ